MEIVKTPVVLVGSSVVAFSGVFVASRVLIDGVADMSGVVVGFGDSIMVGSTVVASVVGTALVVDVNEEVVDALHVERAHRNSL